MKRWLVGLVLAPLAAACGGDALAPEPGSSLRPDVRAYVTGAALASLDGNGHFRFDTPPTHWGDRRLITPARALELADAFLRTYVLNPDVATPPLPGSRSMKERLEWWHGQPIDWQRLSLGPSPPLPLFVESHVEPLPDTVPTWLVNASGPWFVVHVHTGARPVFSVGVAAHATDVEIDEDGFLRLPYGGGNWFFTGEIPAWLGVTVPLFGEAAARYAATETGAMVTEVPVLGAPGIVSPRHSRWRVEVDRPVEVERLVDGARTTTTELFVGLIPSWIEPSLEIAGYGLRLFVAAEQQATSVLLDGDEFPVRSGYAIRLHEVRPVR